ncbi:glutathione S-transferase III [Vibrio orientalis CIP 102891 = ATCC 33934]|uniref:glutathione transferase n=1 Tax=Vibrio orientalis CIP 102891 = ATCC 33934 TaxID=675816 RepID=C9QE42_VIBOR|nr:glutathione S-transferase [Vibrio orientalis]EEX94182.1 glutathione S-transferase [Vibrio orientalis CIP 102891 = ATCC 33934]EGU44503.1 glutathione S-transferase III [Vibrio orientalis CIP 102891 = ATCC 33934]
MITLHHLNQSRSKRIIWLLEELEVDYHIVPYQRDSVTFLAPPELKSIHPLGKSPVIEDQGRVITESGAITEYLISKYAPERLAPNRDSDEYVDYIQWLHFAESSAALPLLLKIFVAKDGAPTNFLADYAELELDKVMSYVDHSLEGKRYFVADKLTGADVMMSFIVEALNRFGLMKRYPNIAQYAKQLTTHAAWQKAEQLEVQYS